MIRWMSTARISAGKGVAAFQWVKEIIELSMKIKGAAQPGVYADFFGEPGTIRVFADYDDLAAFEAVSSQLLVDEAYLKKMEEAAGLFVDGSHRTVIMRGI